MEAAYKKCQSCGMPLHKDPEGGGTEADGSKSRMYCSLCYKDGRFCNPEMTVADMQKLVKEKIKQMRLPGFMAWLFARGIPKLGRWRKK